MKYNLPNEFKIFQVIKKAIYFFIILIIALFLYYISNFYISLLFFIILIIITFNCIFNFIKFKKYQVNNYIIIDDKKLINYKNNTYTLYFEENIIPIKNILYYFIKQGFIMKKFKLYKIIIASSSLETSIYVNEEKILEMENIIKNSINKNLIRKNISDEK